MIFYTVITGLTALLGLGLGLFVYFHKPRTSIKISWVIFSFTVGFWSLGYFVCLAATSYQVAITASRLSHASGAFIPISFFHFVLILVNREGQNKLLLKAGYALGALMFFASLTPWVVSDVLPKMGLRFYPEWGLLYTVYAAMYVGFVGYAHILMIQAIRATKGLEKLRIIYLFTASTLGFSGGISLFLLIFNIPFPPYASALICLYPIIMSYSIVKHKLMDIEVIIKKTLVFAGIVAAAACVISFPIGLIQLILGKTIGISPFWLLVSGIVTTALIYRPLEHWFVNLTDKYLFQKKVNYRILLKEATEYLAHLDSLKWQARRIIAFLLLKARITNACIYSFHSFAPGSLLLQASRPRIKAEGHKVIVLSHPLVQYMRVHRGSVELRILEEAKASEKDPEKIKALNQMISLFKEHRAEAAIPCFGSGAAERARHTELHLRGILFLGHQKSDEPYTEEDLDVFFTLGQESSIAFENARLYDEAVERAQELGRTNQQLNDAQTRLMLALSEAERANERLRVTQAALIVAEKNATMVGMAKAIGHEVNNPLSTVDGRAKWIYKDLVTSCMEILDHYDNVIEEDDFKKLVKLLLNIDDHAQRISHSAKRIEYVVKTLTNILKDTKGEMGPLSLTVMCHEAIEATRFQTYDENLSGCNIDLDIVANVMVRGNLEQLLQVLVNLIKNAFEAMGKQKERSIAIRGYADPEDSKMARIEVSDNGPGIPSGILPKIWTQGFSTKVKTGDGIGAHGQGQGLFVCKHMIESVHGGLIYAESTVGKGTTFVVKLPLASD